MDTFTLLKYWIDRLRPTHTSRNHIHSSSDQNHPPHHDASFINLELLIPQTHSQNKDTNHHKEEEEEEEEEAYCNSTEKEKEMDLALSCMSSSSVELTDVLLNGKLLSVNSYSLSTEEKNEMGITHATTSLLLKSVTKFRVFLLRFKRSKTTKEQTLEEEEDERNDKFFTVKIKVEEAPTTTSSSSSSVSKTQVGDEKRSSKEIIQRYVKMVKPISIRVSKRYASKLGFSGQQAEAPPSYAAGDEQEIATPAAAVGVEEVIANTKGMRIVAGLLMTRRRLRSRRSSSATVAAAPSTAAPPGRRDDSLREQHDGIQSAILHCKRSLNPIPIAADSDACVNEKKEGGEEEVHFLWETPLLVDTSRETPLLDGKACAQERGNE